MSDPNLSFEEMLRDAISMRGLAKGFYNQVLATPGAKVSCKTPELAKQVEEAGKMLRHGLEMTPEYLASLKVPAEGEAVPRSLPDGLIEVIREAAAIIAEIPPGQAPSNMRYPIMDELEGYAAMLEDVQAPTATPRERM